MTAFRRVEASEAGASALGILVPPGETTLVIVRPRPLSWDLLAARWNGDSHCPPAFCQFGRDEAAGVARRLQQTLDQAVAQGDNPIETFGSSKRFQVWVRTQEFFWILCRRAPGQAYEPAIFATQEEAQFAARQLTPFLWPAPGAGQEIYFNTQKLSMSWERAK